MIINLFKVDINSFKKDRKKYTSRTVYEYFQNGGCLAKCKKCK